MEDVTIKAILTTDQGTTWSVESERLGYGIMVWDHEGATTIQEAATIGIPKLQEVAEHFKASARLLELTDGMHQRAEDWVASFNPAP